MLLISGQVVIIAFGAALAIISLVGYIWCVIYYNRSVKENKRKIYDSQKDIIFNEGRVKFNPKAYRHPVQAKLEVGIEMSDSYSQVAENADISQKEIVISDGSNGSESSR